MIENYVGIEKNVSEEFLMMQENVTWKSTRNVIYTDLGCIINTAVYRHVCVHSEKKAWIGK